jgi:hypothetical protein
MPSSRPTTIPVVIHLLRQLRPQSILDVGVGFGKWGHLFREYTDINEAEREPNRYQRQHWQVRIDGIEGHAPYLTEMHRYLYNEVHVGDARSVLAGLPIYDLVFLGDIIEHFDKPAGIDLLQLALEHAAKAVVVSTPKFETDQENLCGNELERHRSLWAARDFRRWPRAQVKTVGGDTLIAVLPRPGQKPISFAPEKRPSEQASALLRAARAELLQVIPAAEPFILVDEEQLRPTLSHHAAQPFLEKNGIYWGPPGNDDTAIAELERMRATGIQRIAFLWSTFWWLDHYAGFNSHLRSQWRLTHESQALRVFSCRQDSVSA